MFNALILGGTGLISTSLTRQLLARGARVTVFNRGLTQAALPAGVRHIAGDRDDREAFVRAFERERFDVVFDMICYAPEHAEDTARAFRGRCEQLVLCSSAVTYGPQIPPEYHRQVARALDTPARVICAPTRWLLAQAPERFGFLAEISRFHCVFSSAKARAHVPEFRAEIGLEAGARETFADLRSRGAWPDTGSDEEYQRIVDRAVALGLEIEDA